MRLSLGALLSHRLVTRHAVARAISPRLRHRSPARDHLLEPGRALAPVHRFGGPAPRSEQVLGRVLAALAPPQNHDVATPGRGRRSARRVGLLVLVVATTAVTAWLAPR